MKFILSLILILPLFLPAQSVDWVKTGPVMPDNNEINLRLCDAASDEHGNLWVAWTHLIKEYMGCGQNPLPPEYRSAGMLCKYSPEGDSLLQWEFPGYSAQISAICAAPGGGIFIAGNGRPTRGQIPEENIRGQHGNCFLGKISDSGELEWLNYFRGIKDQFQKAYAPVSILASATHNRIALTGYIDPTNGGPIYKDRIQQNFFATFDLNGAVRMLFHETPKQINSGLDLAFTQTGEIILLAEGYKDYSDEMEILIRKIDSTGKTTAEFKTEPGDVHLGDKFIGVDESDQVYFFGALGLKPKQFGGQKLNGNHYVSVLAKFSPELEFLTLENPFPTTSWGNADGMIMTENGPKIYGFTYGTGTFAGQELTIEKHFNFITDVTKDLKISGKPLSLSGIWGGYRSQPRLVRKPDSGFYLVGLHLTAGDVAGHTLPAPAAGKTTIIAVSFSE